EHEDDRGAHWSNDRVHAALGHSAVRGLLDRRGKTEPELDFGVRPGLHGRTRAVCGRSRQAHYASDPRRPAILALAGAGAAQYSQTDGSARGGGSGRSTVVSLSLGVIRIL